MSWSYIVGSVALCLFLWTRTQSFKLRHIPTVGTTVPIASLYEGFQFLRLARQRMQEGYDKYASQFGIFKIAMPDQWLVLITNPVFIDEIRKMPDDAVDLRGGIDQVFAGRYIHGKEWTNDPIHVRILYTKFNQALGETFPAVKDEIWHAFSTDIGHPEDWRSVPAVSTMTKILTKAINRVFVGMPLCRDQEFLGHVNKCLFERHLKIPYIRNAPPFLKGVVANLVLPGPKLNRAIHDYLGPIIQERRRLSLRYRDSKETWHDKPNDMLMWLIDEAIVKGYSDETVTLFLLATESASIFNTAASFVHALYQLAADVSLVTPLREEVEEALAAEGGGWNRNTVAKLVKIDSFLRESQRINGVDGTTLWRIVRKPITFSNGTSVPAGTFLSAATAPYHTDEQQYKNPNTFDPWRFVDSSKTFVTTSVDYIPFGHGRHACPGRHLASYEMKLMLAYIVMRYDVAFASGRTGTKPPNVHLGTFVRPDRKVNIAFRKRR